MADTHVPLAGSRRPLAQNARKLRDIDPHAHISATVVLSAPSLPKSDAFPDKALSPQELADRYGAPTGMLRKVEVVLRGFGLGAQPVSPSGRTVRISGPASAFEAAFKAGLAIYHSPAEGDFRGREGQLSVPAELDGAIQAVLGLDQRRMVHRQMATTPGLKITATVNTPLTPSDLETHYNFPDGDGSGQKIAIAVFGIPPQVGGPVVPPAWFPDDIAAFCAAHGRKAPPIRTVPVGLAPLTPEQVQALPPDSQQAVEGASGEGLMNALIIGALCPAADIAIYYAPWGQDGWINLLEQVIKDQPVALSISYALVEDSPHWSSAALSAINDHLQLAAMAGITVCVSSGDDGTGCKMTDSKAHVEFPAASPWVLAVGGTMLQGSGGTLAEVAWWQSPGRRTGNGQSGATGGGVSALFDRPAWQLQGVVASVNGPGSHDGRVVPDVAALAGPPLYQLTMFGQPAPNGGTSASAPLWAALVARIDAALPPEKKQRFLGRLLYQASGDKLVGEIACTAITNGDNTTRPHPGKGYAAQAGFNAVAGWGVPNGKALVAAL